MKEDEELRLEYLRQEKLWLDEADQHIARVEELIRLQQERIEQAQAHGQATKMMQALLASMLEALAAMEDHRRLIIERIKALTKPSWP